MFLLKSQLPQTTQSEIDRIEAIPSGQRTTDEANLLVSLAPYLSNRVEKYDEDGNILMCAGETVPTDGESGFAKGCIFIKENAGSGVRSLYENIGTSSSCVFNSLNDVTISDTPVNAVASTGVTLTSNNDNVTNGKKVVLGAITYTFKTTLSADPTVAYEVLIGANADATLTNLKKAINGESGAGTNYSTGTVAHSLVTCGSVTSHAVALTAKIKGTIGDISVSTDETTLSFNNPAFAGGVNGTVGQAGEIRYDTSYLYIAKAANTIADNNWRRVSLGSAY